jgi:formylglycine-generating enzyme required for sulfatase activity
VASTITLKGIDQAISHLKYINENTLKYRFVRCIRQHYADDYSVASLQAIDHTTLIKRLWDTGDDPGAVKNRRKNLNSLRSAVNADLKKLYEKGLNAEGIKIGSDNIFVMSENAKDNILNTFGIDLQPDGTLKLDQIMDILKLANETVSDSLVAEDTGRKADLSKKDQLKNLIKGLSEKLGLGAPEFSKTVAVSEDQPSEPHVSPDNTDSTRDIAIVDEDEVLSEAEGIEDEEVLEEIRDIKEDEILDELEEIDEAIVDDSENILTDYVEDSDPEDVTVEEEIDEDVEDAEDDEDTELEYVDVSQDEGSGDGTGGEAAYEFGVGDKHMPEGLSLDRGLGQGEKGNDLDETGSMIGDLKPGFGAEDKGDGKGIDENIESKSHEQGFGFNEMAEVLDDIETGAVDEITELDDSEEIEALEEADILDDIGEEISDVVEDVVTDDIEDSDSEMISEEEEIDEVLEDAADDNKEFEYIDAVEDDGFVDGIEGEPSDESGTGGNEKKEEIEQLGLPIDSLGQEFSSEKDTKLKKTKLLAETFDGYLGTMDRHYNHYILIDGGNYLIGSRHPKKDEKAEQAVYLEPFYIGRFPVTNGLFEIFVEKTGYKTTAEKAGYGTVYYGRFEKRKDDRTGLITSKWNASLYSKVVKGACWYCPSGPQSSLYNKRNHPVVQVSLEDAEAFAAWTGKRLPTENEWEAASRTAKGWIFPWGHEWKNDAHNIEDSGIADTTPVDKYAEFENDFGIVDALGNVLEWTDNGFGIPPEGNNASIYRIAKGGSWVSGNDVRLFSRFKLEPDSHSNILGFRCVAY